MKHCNNPKCSTSTGIHDGTTHGYGKLSQNGFWQFPCFTCARHYEDHFSEDWPFPETKPIEMQHVECEFCGQKTEIHMDDNKAMASICDHCWEEEVCNY